MPEKKVIYNLWVCGCDDWLEHARNILIRTLYSMSYDSSDPRAPMFIFCPYCGKKLVLSDFPTENIGSWGGKLLLEYTYSELIDIINVFEREIENLGNELLDAALSGIVAVEKDTAD